MTEAKAGKQEQAESRKDKLKRLYNFDIEVHPEIMALIQSEVQKDMANTYNDPTDLTPDPLATDAQRKENMELLRQMIFDNRRDTFLIARWLAQHGQTGRQFLYPLYGYDNVLRQAMPKDTLIHMQMVPKEKDKDGKEKAHLLEYLDPSAIVTEKPLQELPPGLLNGIFILDESAEHIQAHLEDYVRILDKNGYMLLSTSEMDDNSQKKLDLFTQDKAQRFQVVSLPKEFVEENSANAMYYLIRKK